MAYVTNTLNVSASNTWELAGAVMAADTRCNVYITNRGSSSGNVRVGISAASPTNAECIFYDFPIAGKGTFIITDVLVKSGDGVWIYSPLSFSVRVEGIAEVTTTVPRAPATLGTYGPNNGVLIPFASLAVPASTNSFPDGVERDYVFTGKNSSGNTVTTYTPNSVMSLVYVNAGDMNSSGYGNNAFIGATYSGTIPPNYNNGALIRDLINIAGVVTVEISWPGMSAPFIINLTPS